MGFLRPLFEKAIGSVIRSGMLALGGYLMAQGLITEDQSTQLLALAPMLAGLAWSLWQKYSAQVAVEVAKELPAGATNHQVKAEIKKSDTAENISRALSVH